VSTEGEETWEEAGEMFQYVCWGGSSNIGYIKEFAAWGEVEEVIDYTCCGSKI
jgi:hypothetical protein